MEKRRGEEIAKKLAITRKKITDTRSRMQGYDDVAAARRREKLLKAAEYRLQHEQQRLSSKIAQNKALKDDVESLRRDRMQRLGIIDKVEAQLQSIRENVETVATRLRSEAEARDAAQREVQALQRMLKTEMREFEVSFEAKIEQVGKEAAAPARLEQMERQAVQSESEALLLHLGSTDGHHGTLSITQERQLKHKSTRTLWEIAKREVEVTEQRSALVEFEDAFAAIKEGTSIKTIDEMVTAFAEAEDASYSLVTMINEASRELETEEVHLAELRAQTDAVVASATDEDEHELLVAIAGGDDGDDDVPGDGSGRPPKADATVEELHQRAEAYDAQYGAAVRLLDRIKPGVHSLFQKVGAADEAAMESLAATGVSDSNILLFLGVVESRISEIVRLQRSLGIAATPLPVAAFSPRAVAAAAATTALEASASADGRGGFDGTYRSGGQGGGGGTDFGAVSSSSSRTASAAALSAMVVPTGPALRKPQPPSMGGPIAPRPATATQPGASADAPGFSAGVAPGGPRASRARLTAGAGSARLRTAHRPTQPDQGSPGSAPSPGQFASDAASDADAAMEEDALPAEATTSTRGSALTDWRLDVGALKQQLGLAPRTQQRPGSQRSGLGLV